MSAPDSKQRSLRLLIELGRGGMGIVYLALAQGPGGFSKLKVIKRLRPDLAGETGAVQMFLEEGRLSARLHHPNIVQMNEVGFDGKHYFLEMEYLEGQSLTALMKRAARAGRGGLSRPLAVYVLAQTLAGLHYAHELNDHDGTPLSVVHRDVSPHNVLVTYDGRVKVLDFGIAKAAGSSSETKTGFLKGKVTYMAPEQVARKALDRRVDVFAVGVILWEALTGQRLWGDLDDFDIFLKLRSEAIPSPRSVGASVPEALEAVCMRALAREPAERFATAEEMQRALEAWLESAEAGAHVGAKELAARMGELFGEDRAATKLEIEAQLKATPVDGSLVGVPMLRPANVSAITGTGIGTTSKTVGGDGTRVRQAREIRGLRTIALGALGVALVASVAAGVVTVRGKRAKGGATAEGSAAASVAGGECARSAECNAGDAAGSVASARVCRKGKCVALATEQCEVLAEPGDANDDRTVWIGAMFPRTGADGDNFGRDDTNAVELARRDFHEATRGIPSHSADAAPRPLALLACDDEKDATTIALHLVEDVGVPAVIGFKSSAEAIALARDIFVPRGVFVAAIDTSAQVTQVPQPKDGPRLVWRAASLSTLMARPAARIVTELIEPSLRRSGGITPTEPMRVVFLRQRDQYGLSMAEAVARDLVFNGRPALANGDDFAQLVYDDPSSPGPRPDYPGLVAKLLRLAPQVILYAGEEELVDNVMAPVERAWHTRGRPYWVSVTNLMGRPLLGFLGKDAERRRRFFGVSAPENSPANAQLAMHYSSEFAKIDVNDTPAASYDAAYLVAYAVYAAGESPLTGRSLAGALARLIPPGKPADVGPTHIFEAIDALSRGENVDLNGACTKLDFDLGTGETTADTVIQCFGVGADGLASDAIESGVTFDVTSGKLGGELRCP